MKYRNIFFNHCLRRFIPVVIAIRYSSGVARIVRFAIILEITEIWQKKKKIVMKSRNFWKLWFSTLFQYIYKPPANCFKRQNFHKSIKELGTDKFWNFLNILQAHAVKKNRWTITSKIWKDEMFWLSLRWFWPVVVMTLD